MPKITVTSVSYGQRYYGVSNIIMRLWQILLSGGQLELRKCFCALHWSARMWPQDKNSPLGSHVQHAKVHNSVEQTQRQHRCIYSRFSCKINLSLSKQNAFTTFFLTGGKIYNHHPQLWHRALRLMGFSFEKPITAQGNMFHSLSSPLQIYALFLSLPPFASISSH